MEAEDFEAGMKVIARHADWDPPRKATVIGRSVSEPDMIAVEWEDGELDRVAFDCLEAYDESFEKDFEQIKAKLEQATELLSEARDIAEKRGTTIRNLSYDYDLDTSLLKEIAMDVGWSSSNCY
jgi:hypothetical protein